MSEKLCLKWNDFQENVNAAFSSSREENEFADVTLACEDGQQIEAHKMILAASSPFFKNLLKRNKHPHPLIFMRGTKSEDLLAIIDFLYLGEANVLQENLDSFLAIAEELQLKGLDGQSGDTEKKTAHSFPDPNSGKNDEKTNLKTEQMQISYGAQQLSPALEMNKDRTMAITKDVIGDLNELDEVVKSMMETSQNMDSKGIVRLKVCKICGKEGQATAMKDHIEANHLEGVSLPCNVCGKAFRSRHSLRRHICRN